MPISVEQLQEFNFNFEASGLEIDTQYYIKVRLGKDGSYTKGETKNGEQWLSDTDAWTSFPTATSNSSGAIATIMTGKAKDTTEIGTNQLFVRLRKVGGNSNVSPDGETTITISAAPAPTPTSIPTSTPIPSTPLPTQAPTNTPTPTTRPAPTHTPAPHKKPTLMPTIGVEELASDSGAVLGESTMPTPTLEPTPTETVKVEGTSWKTPVMASVFIVLGFGLVGFSAFSFWQQYNQKNEVQ
ncbi:MAG: hypothetical protein HY376_00420 [Candidatus Blackburnbacteria bacterium]|nr:hypothetical protein [Candidatus Blackburnbacteria bacterium]